MTFAPFFNLGHVDPHTKVRVGSSAKELLAHNLTPTGNHALPLNLVHINTNACAIARQPNEFANRFTFMPFGHRWGFNLKSKYSVMHKPLLLFGLLCDLKDNECVIGSMAWKADFVKDADTDLLSGHRFFTLLGGVGEFVFASYKGLPHRGSYKKTLCQYVLGKPQRRDEDELDNLEPDLAFSVCSQETVSRLSVDSTCYIGLDSYSNPLPYQQRVALAGWFHCVCRYKYDFYCEPLYPLVGDIQDIRDQLAFITRPDLVNWYQDLVPECLIDDNQDARQFAAGLVKAIQRSLSTIKRKQ